MNRNSNYPPGAEHDPNAPYNEKEPKPVKVKLDVYLTIHKVVEIETTNYGVFEGEVCDGEYLAPQIFVENFDELKGEVIEQTTLPHQLAYLVEHGKATKQDLQDASGWNIDDVEVYEH